MPTMCIQCSMKALLEGQTPPIFDETPEEHQQHHHSDLALTKRERAELERRWASHVKGSSKP